MYDFTLFCIIIYSIVMMFLVIFNWDWLSEHQHRGANSWLKEKWGDKGARIATGVFTIVFLVLAILIWRNF
ncbi:Imm17 family immunity protein [Clostridium boliviensis]|uniref:Imm17 family immunity protein n=1 Tax=Clostridium boliviensis TaxID=318465 RepID=A0ABU4GQM8_9CLOT|nr:Imm17 family immunity protein [Clostridium boliviensis]MDW2799883.1 Imm17 family immunity protein [Clostridium boliviensis]